MQTVSITTKIETSWRGILDTTICDQVCQQLATGQWFSLDTPETDKTDHHDGTEIFLKVAYKTKDYKIVICCFSDKHTALRRKSKD
jgi:hypothetical protein